MQEIKEVQLSNLFAQTIRDYLEGLELDEEFENDYEEFVHELTTNLIEAYAEFEKRMARNKIN